MAKYYELRESSISWESDKAYGVDYPSGGRRPTRIFYPKSLAKVSDSGGVILMPEWIIEKKKSRVADPYDAFITSYPAIEIAEPAEKIIDASNLLAFFDNAAASVKFPKVKFKDVVLSRKGARAKVPGSVHVTDHGSYPDNKWYGMIDLDGKYTPTRKATPEVVELVEKFNADPEGFLSNSIGHNVRLEVKEAA